MTEKTQFDEETIRVLQDMRRANAAIIGCIEILNEHDCNEPSIPAGPSVFIRLEAHQEMGLHYAIEACSRDIARIFDNDLEELGVNWLDDICPDVTHEAQQCADMRNGKISFSEFKKNTGLPDSLQ